MRDVAQAQSQHPGVRYLAGSAEDLPVPSSSADYALMFLSWHHVQDKPQAARELTRVLRPAGRLLLRTNFSDHHPRPWWAGFQRLEQAVAADPGAAAPVLSEPLLTLERR
jgi:ubiquinone/menaquinone biosynthesis C-methylase UbiE